MLAVTRRCAACREDRVFAPPPCADEHGPDCPELACVECGAAILLGDAPPVERAGTVGLAA